MIKKLLAATFFTLLPNLANATVYSCPEIPISNYISIVSEISNWHVYAVDQMHKPLTQFAVTSRPIWDDFVIETTEDSKISILFCSSISSNGYINSMRFVDEPNCSADPKNSSFICN